MNKNKLPDLSPQFEQGVNKNCAVCGTSIKKSFYSNKPMCYKCWKKINFKSSGIKDVMSRLGESSISGEKTWIDEYKQNKAIKKYKLGVD